jgi:hypothetical protein
MRATRRPSHRRAYPPSGASFRRRDEKASGRVRPKSAEPSASRRGSPHARDGEPCPASSRRSAPHLRAALHKTARRRVPGSALPARPWCPDQEDHGDNRISPTLFHSLTASIFKPRGGGGTLRGPKPLSIFRMRCGTGPVITFLQNQKKFARDPRTVFTQRSWRFRPSPPPLHRRFSP